MSRKKSDRQKRLEGNPGKRCLGPDRPVVEPRGVIERPDHVITNAARTQA